MYTKSAVIIWFVGVFKKLNYYFEYSFIYKILVSIGKAAYGSKIIKSFNAAPKRDYAGGSLILRPLYYISGAFFNMLKKLFLAISHANRTSFNKKAFDTAIVPLKTTEGIISAICLVLGGIMIVLGISRFGSAFMVIGLVMGVVFIALGVLLPDFLARAFKGSAPAWLIKWFFNEE